MKKLTILTAVAFIALSVTSCKKDRTCTCTYTTPSGSTTYTVVVTKVTKGGASQGACSSHTDTYTSNSVSYTNTTTCTVK